MSDIVLLVFCFGFKIENVKQYTRYATDLISSVSTVKRETLSPAGGW